MSLATGSNPSITAAIAGIGDARWTAIHYPDAFVDTETGELVSDAEVAEIPSLAFTSRPKAQQVDGRLIVRRVKRLDPGAVTAGQDELFTLWRHHAVFLTSGVEMLQAEGHHRHDPRPPDQHARPDRPPRPPPDPAPAPGLALASRLGRPARRSPPTTRSHGLTIRPPGLDPRKPPWKNRTDRRPSPARNHDTRRIKI